MVKLSHRAYEKIQRVAKLIHEELESQIKPSPVLFESNKLPNDISEKIFTDALKYLSEEGLISYNCNTKNTAAFYEYDRQYKDAKAKLYSAEYFLGEDRLRDNIRKDIDRYDNQRKAEAERWHSTIFTIQPQASFNEKYNKVMANCGSHSENEGHQPIQKIPITNFPLRLHYEVKPNANDSNLQDASIYINNIEIRTIGPSVIGKIIQYAFSEAIPDSDIFTVIDIRKINLKYTRNMSSLIRDFLDSDLLGKIFFEKIPRSKHSFKMRTEVSEDTIKESGFDTVSVLNEVERLAKKRRKNRGQ